MYISLQFCEAAILILPLAFKLIVNKGILISVVILGCPGGAKSIWLM